MKKFEAIDPLTITTSPNVVAKLADYKQPTKTWYILVVDNHVIISNATFFKDFETSESEWLHYQIEFPKQGLQWYLETIREKFFKTEAEGGLPKDTFEISTVIDGEKILVARSFSSNGHGYSFYTLDRKDEYDFPKSYLFTDELLFEHGLFDLFQSVADRIASGEL